MTSIYRCLLNSECWDRDGKQHEMCVQIFNTAARIYGHQELTPEENERAAYYALNDPAFTESVKNDLKRYDAILVSPPTLAGCRTNHVFEILFMSEVGYLQCVLEHSK